MTATEDQVIAATRAFLHERCADEDVDISAESAVCQDLLIFGIDVDDYHGDLRGRFGPIINEIPWLRFTDQTDSFRGCGCLLVPFWLAGRLVKRVFRPGDALHSDPRNHPERLTLRHVAAVIDAGQWFEPGESPP